MFLNTSLPSVACLKVSLEVTYGLAYGPFKADFAAKQALQVSDTKTMQSLGGTKENKILGYNNLVYDR